MTHFPKMTSTTNIVKISGSVGQQMFQYAFALALHHRGSYDLKLDADSRHWIGNLFPLQQRNIASAQEVRTLVNKTFTDKIINILKGVHPQGCYEETDNAYKPELLEQEATYFDGGWLSHRYFDSFADELINEFTVPEHLLNDLSQQSIHDFQSCESVAVTVYRPTSKENTCTRDYYNWAITHIKQFIENPHFTVFTDNPEWVAANLMLDSKNADIIGTPTKGHHAIIPVCSRAKHNIIANTLESWWAAWLNTNPDKIVIAPQLWSKTQPTPDLVPQDWITIPVT